MDNRIPVPTDNIYKFYALFGLLLFVFSCGAFLYINRSSNEVVFAAVPELEALRHNASPSTVDSAKIAVLEKRLEINKANKQFYQQAIGVLLGSSILAIIFGFLKWHYAVQPVLDRTAKAQMEIAELQLAKLRRELEALPRAADATSATENAQRSGT
jgi:hypothetical protein